MWITIISNALQFLLLGILVQFGNTHTELRQKHKGKYLLGCVLLSFFIFGLASWGAYRQGERVEELRKAVTGGNSFPVVIPQGHQDRVELVIANFGDAALSGVGVGLAISCKSPIAPQTIMMGTLSAHAMERLATVLDLTQCRDFPPSGGPPLVIEHEKVATYWIDMSAQNGTYIELLQFKKGDSCRQWSFRYWVFANPGVGITAKGEPDIVGDLKKLYQVPDEPERWTGDEQCQKDLREEGMG